MRLRKGKQKIKENYGLDYLCGQYDFCFRMKMTNRLI